MSRISILIADDHPVVRAGLASMLATYPDLDVVGNVSDGQQALDLIRTRPVDILLLDLRMPSLNGEQTLRAIRQLDAPPRVIVLTSYESDEDIYGAIRAGAHGYLLKASSEEEMMSAIHTVHAGKRYLPPHIAARFADRVPRANLEPRQREILDLIAEGLTDTQIAEKTGLGIAEIWDDLNTIIETLDALEESRLQAGKITIADIAREAGVSMATTPKRRVRQ